MAVSPREAAKINDELERKSVELMEEVIDTRLNKEFRTGQKVEFWAQTLRKIPGWTKRAQEEVFRRFRAAGWKISPRDIPDRQGSERVYDFSETPTHSYNYQEQGGPPPWSGIER